MDRLGEEVNHNHFLGVGMGSPIWFAVWDSVDNTLYHSSIERTLGRLIINSTMTHPIQDAVREITDE